ncbi:MAG TPA: hypothetical protein ENJ65_06310, partial [Candidatus Tenderia electrophaga]|nr:hypothetical protein [Candidatus Tenderia electrophaga]
MSKAQQKTDTKTPTPEKQSKTPANKAETKPSPAKATASISGDTPPKKGNGMVGFVALIIAIGAFGAGYKAWQQIGIEQSMLNQRINTTEKNIAAMESGTESSRSIAETVQSTNQLLQNRLDSMETKISSLDGKLEEKTSSLSKQLEEQSANLNNKISELDSKIASSIEESKQGDAAISESLSKLSDSLRTNKDDNLLVTEARHLINIANHQAQLNQNPTAAAAALAAANRRLSDAADPTLLETRQIITDDIIALRSIAALDISGIALALSQLEASIDGLPLSSETVTPDATASAATEEVSDANSFFNKVWSDIKGLVSIRHNAQHSTAMLPPGQRFFLQQNLRLKLETARLALLQRDSQTFHSSLNTAGDWIKKYFDTSAASTANLLTSIERYQDLELSPALPDLSRSLKALDTWSSKQK